MQKKEARDMVVIKNKEYVIMMHEMHILEDEESSLIDY